MRQHIEFCVLINCHGNHTVLLHLTTYYLAVKVIGEILFLCYMVLRVGISGKEMEGDRGIMLQDSEEKEAKRGRDGEEEERGGKAEGREGRHKGGRRQSR